MPAACPEAFLQLLWLQRLPCMLPPAASSPDQPHAGQLRAPLSEMPQLPAITVHMSSVHNLLCKRHRYSSQIWKYHSYPTKKGNHLALRDGARLQSTDVCKVWNTVQREADLCSRAGWRSRAASSALAPCIASMTLLLCCALRFCWRSWQPAAGRASSQCSMHVDHKRDTS